MTDEVADRPLALAQEVEDLPAVRLGQGGVGGGGHKPKHDHLVIRRQPGSAPDVAEEPLHPLAEGLWHWPARHPQWHPGAFGAEVGSYALATDETLLLVDPLLPEPGDAVLAALDALAAARAVHVLVTLGYHARSAERLAERLGAGIHGPANVASRLRDPSRLTVLEPGARGPAGVLAHGFGRPRRSERPLWLGSHAALAFGDAVVTTPEGELRLWAQRPVDERSARWHRDVLAPTLAPLLEHPVRHVLTTHGPPVVGDGAAALRDALAAPPWYHRPG